MLKVRNLEKLNNFLKNFLLVGDRLKIKIQTIKKNLDYFTLKSELLATTLCSFNDLCETSKCQDIKLLIY